MNRIRVAVCILSLIALFGLLSCQDSIEKEASDWTEVKVHFNLAIGSQSRTSAVITDGLVLDSLVKNIRILILNNTGVCETYADINPVQLSNGNIFKIVSPIGVKSFIFLTNVADQAYMSNPIGQTADQILITLKSEKRLSAYTQYEQAPQLFFSRLDGILIQSNNLPVETTVMQRIVSQLETSVVKQVYHTDANGNKTSPFATGYLQRLDSLYIYTVSPDINLLQAINNRSGHTPKYDLTNSLIADSKWKATGTNKERSVALSFPSDGQNMHPYLVIAAETDPNNSDFIASASDRNGPHGGVLRYWSFLLKQHQLKPNKRLLVDITALLGGGAPNPIPPPDSAQVEFTIQVKDWELLEDTISGGKDDFLD